MTLSTGALRPSRIQREAKTEARVPVYSDDEPIDAGHLPQFAFTTGTTRPTTWKTGRWDGTTAETPTIGQTVTLTVGTHQVWLKVNHDGQTPVLPVGRITIE